MIDKLKWWGGLLLKLLSVAISSIAFGILLLLLSTPERAHRFFDLTASGDMSFVWFGAIALINSVVCLIVLCKKQGRFINGCCSVYGVLYLVSLAIFLIKYNELFSYCF